MNAEPRSHDHGFFFGGGGVWLTLYNISQGSSRLILTSIMHAHNALN